MIWMFDVTPAIRAFLAPRTEPTSHVECGDSAIAVFTVKKRFETPWWVVAVADRGDADWTAVNVTGWQNEVNGLIDPWRRYFANGGSVAAWVQRQAEARRGQFPPMDGFR